MRVPVDEQGCPGVVGSLGQEVAAEEGVDFRRLAGQGARHRRVVQERDAEVSLQVVQGRAEVAGQAARVPHERLHLRLPEIRGAHASETAAEALRAGYPEPPARQFENQAASLEDDYAAVPQHGGDLVLAVAVVVVVAEHRHDGNVQSREFRGGDLRLLARAALRQVPRYQQDVGVRRQPGQVRPYPSPGIGRQVHVPDRRHPDHRRLPSGASTTVIIRPSSSTT